MCLFGSVVVAFFFFFFTVFSSMNSLHVSSVTRLWFQSRVWQKPHSERPCSAFLLVKTWNMGQRKQTNKEKSSYIFSVDISNDTSNFLCTLQKRKWHLQRGRKAERAGVTDGGKQKWKEVCGGQLSVVQHSYHQSSFARESRCCTCWDTSAKCDG